MTLAAAAKTDRDWFYRLRDITPKKAVFWTPSGWDTARLSRGDYFHLFLKAPIKRFGGFGEYEGFRDLRIGEAWEEYGVQTGAANLDELIARVSGYRDGDEVDREIGCIILNEPVFYDDDNMISPDEAQISMPDQVVTFKYLSEEEDQGLRERARTVVYPVTEEFLLVPTDPQHYRYSQQKDRKGAPSFRQQVLRAYEDQCAISRETAIEAIEAAHIQPYIDERSNSIQNGLPLRADLHKLFDAGLITVDPSYRVVVSPSLSHTEYSRFDGSKIVLPASMGKCPSKSALRWHNTRVYRG